MPLSRSVQAGAPVGIGKNSICIKRRRRLRLTAPYRPTYRGTRFHFRSAGAHFCSTRVHCRLKRGFSRRWGPIDEKLARGTGPFAPWDAAFRHPLCLFSLRLYLMTLCFAGLGIGGALTVIGLLQFTVWFCHECTLSGVNKTRVKKLSLRCDAIGLR